jgi:hypothetical protein
MCPDSPIGFESYDACPNRRSVLSLIPRGQTAVVFWALPPCVPTALWVLSLVTRVLTAVVFLSLTTMSPDNLMGFELYDACTDRRSFEPLPCAPTAIVLSFAPRFLTVVVVLSLMPYTPRIALLLSLTMYGTFWKVVHCVAALQTVRF